MNENEVLIVEIPDVQYDSLINDIIKYSIISLPFTIDRMRQVERYGVVEGNKKRIANIFKGKLAEKLFEFFCKQNNLNVDFSSCETPFYQTDNRDFIYDGNEYDIKNNFIYHEGEIYNNYTKLPALIPNRHENDQWGSRLKPHFNNMDVGYIFSFLKGATLTNEKRGNNFYNLNIKLEQGSFLHQLYRKYEGLEQTKPPFSEDWFWKEMSSKGDLKFFTLTFRPKLIITDIGNQNNWQKFVDTGPYSQNNYQNNPINNWYKKVGRRNSIKFLNGQMWATITNKTAPITLLPPITNIFSNLSGNIKYGRFKN